MSKNCINCTFSTRFVSVDGKVLFRCWESPEAIDGALIIPDDLKEAEKHVCESWASLGSICRDCKFFCLDTCHNINKAKVTGKFIELKDVDCMSPVCDEIEPKDVC